MHKPFFWALLLCAFSGQAAFSQGVIRLQQGYFFINHTHRSDTKPTQPGDVLLFRVGTWLADTLLSSSEGKLLQYTLPAEPPAEFTPLYEALKRMHFSDSASVLQVIDSTFLVGFAPKWQRYRTLRHSLVLVGQAKPAPTENAAVPNIPGAYVLDSNDVKKIASVKEVLRKTIARQAAQPDFDVTKMDIYILQQGKGAPIKKGEKVTFHYAGALRTGRVFDITWERKQPLEMPVGVGQLLAGFDYGLSQLRHGTHACLFIPAQYAYGAQGSEEHNIPPNTPLVFYVEIF